MSGSNHYAAQRITAIMLIPTSIWFIVFVFNISHANSLEELGHYLLSPISFFVAILFILALLYHGMLGMQEIITDYVHCNVMNKVINNTLIVVTIFSALAAILSIVYFFIVLKVFFPC